jgi:hypothetical protein
VLLGQAEATRIDVDRLQEKLKRPNQARVTPFVLCWRGPSARETSLRIERQQLGCVFDHVKHPCLGVVGQFEPGRPIMGSIHTSLPPK